MWRVRFDFRADAAKYTDWEKKMVDLTRSLLCYTCRCLCVLCWHGQANFLVWTKQISGWCSEELKNLFAYISKQGFRLIISLRATNIWKTILHFVMSTSFSEGGRESKMKCLSTGPIFRLRPLFSASPPPRRVVSTLDFHLRGTRRGYREISVVLQRSPTSHKSL